MIGVILFIILFLTSLTADLKDDETKTCFQKSKSIPTITILHHLFSIFVLFGWMLSPISLVNLYLLVTLSTIVYWGVFGFCHVSKYVNKTCGWNKDKYFNDIVSGLKSTKQEFYFYLVGISIALMRIYYFKK